MLYIFAPFYHDKSNGVAITYELLRVLNRYGIETKVICYEEERYDTEIPEDLKPFYISKASAPKKVNDDDIVIYLDTAAGNVMSAKQVVYWLLNKPGALTGAKIHFQANSVLMAYSTLVHNELPQLFLLKDERDLFGQLRERYEKRKDAVSIYFGKVNIANILKNNSKLKQIVKQYEKVHVITRLSPALREDTLKLIAESDLLISFDSLSALNYEATLLKTPVWLMEDVYDIENTIFNVGNYGFAFCEEGVEEARKNVDKAFVVYCDWVEKQASSIITSVKKMIEQLKRIRENEDAFEENCLRNQKAELDFFEFYHAIEKPFSNIDYPCDIPYVTRRIVLRHQPKKVVANTLDSASKHKGNHTLRNIYTAIRPRWADDMYRKVPSNLRGLELIFLMIRRVLLFPKQIFEKLNHTYSK